MRTKILFNESDKNNIIDLRNNGYTCDQIASVYNISGDTIRTRLINWGEYKPQKPKINFTEEQKEEIIFLYNSGYSSLKLAKMYNVCDATIINFLKEWGVQTGNDKYIIKFSESDKKKIIALYKQGYSTMYISNILNTSSYIIRTRLNSWGISTSDRWVFFTQYEKSTIINLYNNGYSLFKISKMFDCSSYTIWARLKEWGIDTSTIKYTVNHNFFNIIDTAWKAYWLGFVLADGCVSDDNRITVCIHSKDINHLRKFLTNIDSDHLIYIHKNRKEVTVQFASPTMAADLKNHGIVPRKSLIVKPCYNIPLHLVSHFWRGIIDGDGCLNVAKSSGRAFITLCGTYDICNGFKIWCSQFVEFKATVRPTKNPQTFTFTINGKNAAHVIKELYNDSPIYLDRKFESAKKVINHYL